VETLIGDPKKAKEKLGWVHQTPFKELVSMMVEADLKLAGLDPANICNAKK
jgi:GDPmannose 4,6-dehydratase